MQDILQANTEQANTLWIAENFGIRTWYSRWAPNKRKQKLGQILIDLGLISKQQLDAILKIKEEAQKRFILDYNEVPKLYHEYSDKAAKQIQDLKRRK